jgi:hypothetical protein
MKFENIIIKRKEGVKFAQQSGDKNKIHLDYITGYNSQFGENIIHGSYLLIKFLTYNRINDFSFIKIQFFSGFFYDAPIKVDRIKSNKTNDTFKLTQNNEEKGRIEILKKSKIENFNKLKKKTFYKKFTINQKIRKSFITRKIDNELNLSLNYLTKYTGMFYPGEYSLISEIKIKKKSLISSNDVKIYSLKPSSRHPIIYNNLYYKKLEISFLTLVRPKLKIKNFKKNLYLLDLVKKINKNILIIGASTGIGKELFNIFKYKKNNKIILTYRHNRINFKKPNIIIKKINIENDINRIFSIIKSHQPLLVYYFPTPKINLKNVSKQLSKIYKKFYVTIPIKLIQYCIENKSYFFYPSSIYVDEHTNNMYTKTKKIAEKKICKIKDNKLFVNILRIPEINTKQNLSVFNKDLPSFTELLKKNKDFRNKVFFKNLT